MTYDEAQQIRAEGNQIRRASWPQSRATLGPDAAFSPDLDDVNALDWVQVTDEAGEMLLDDLPLAELPPEPEVVVAPAPEPAPVPEPVPVPEPEIIVPPVPQPQPVPQPLGVNLMALQVSNIKPIKLIARVSGALVEVLRILAIEVSQPEAAEAIVSSDNVTAFLEAKQPAQGVTVTASVKIMVDGQARAVTATSNPVDIIPLTEVIDPATGLQMVHEDGTPVLELDLEAKIVE